MGGTIGVDIGLIDGGTIGQMPGLQMGGKSIELVQTGRTWPLMQVH